jgi:hypothetical protein
VFPVRYELNFYILFRRNSVFQWPRVEAGYNTSTVALRVIEGDEKGTRCLGVNWATLSLGDINTGTWDSKLRERLKVPTAVRQ